MFSTRYCGISPAGSPPNVPISLNSRERISSTASLAKLTAIISSLFSAVIRVARTKEEANAVIIIARINKATSISTSVKPASLLILFIMFFTLCIVTPAPIQVCRLKNILLAVIPVQEMIFLGEFFFIAAGIEGQNQLHFK